MSDVWMGVGLVHRGEPVDDILHSELFLQFFNCELWPSYAFDYRNVSVIGTIIQNEGTETSTDVEIFGDGDADSIVGPEGGNYPLFGDGNSNSVYAMTTYEASSLLDNFTEGMTWIVVYQPSREDGTSGMADGGSIVSKLFTGGPSDEEAEQMLYFGASHFGARTKRTFSFQTANWAYNSDTSLSTNQWYILEVYFPPGDTDPVLYVNGVLITGASLTVTDSGVRVDHGQGYLVIGGDANSSPDAAAGYYAMSLFYDHEFPSTCRDEYVAAAINEGWIVDPAGVESIFINANDSGGETTFFPYDNVLLVVQGTLGFFGASQNGDADTTFGTLSTGHGGIFQIWNGSTWVHIEPIGGPYSTPQAGNMYVFEHDGGGNQITMRIGDSAHGDNTGGFSVLIIPVT